MTKEDLKFKSHDDALKFVEHNRIGNERFVTVHGKRIKVRTLRESDTKTGNWTPEIKHLDTGAMSALGYNYRDSITKRRTALKNGLRIYGYANLMHKLTFMLINKNRNPKMYKTIREDMDWLESKR